MLMSGLGQVEVLLTVTGCREHDHSAPPQTYHRVGCGLHNLNHTSCLPHNENELTAPNPPPTQLHRLPPGWSLQGVRRGHHAIVGGFRRTPLYFVQLGSERVTNVFPPFRL